MASRQERRHIITDLIARNEIDSQEQLQDLLRAEGIDTTQATISRDLRDLGIMKGSKGYAPLRIEDVSKIDPKELRQALKAEMISAERAGSILVLRTPFGHARAAAMKLEQSQLPHIVGIMAGDDTVFIATRSPGQAGELRRVLLKLAK
jgi:transcriptional regulator of arginine metabolism